MRPIGTEYSRTVARVALAAVLACAIGACSDSADATRATGMRFATQPPTIVAGQTFSVTVELVDPRNVRVNATDSVRIETEDGTAMTGTKVAVAVGGIATFPGLSITKTGSGFRLIASSKALAAISSAFAVTPGVPTLQTSAIGPTTQPLATGIARNVTFTFSDAFGNPIASQPISITSNLTGASLNPSSGTTTAVGTFASVLTATNPGAVVLTATVGGAQIAFAPILVQPPCTPVPMTFPGSVTGTHPVESCTSEGIPTLSYRFTTASNGAALFSLTSGFPSALSVTSDPPGAAPLVLRGGTTQSSEWLLPAGTYQVRVGAVSGGGDFNLTSTSVPGNQGQVVRNIVVGGTYPQALGTGDFVFPEIFGDNSFWDVFRMRSAGACTITARATGTTGLDLLLLVTDSSGTALTGDDDSAGGTDAQVTVSPCQSSNGPIRVLVNHYLNTPGGQYTLTVSFAGAQPSVRVNDPPRSWETFTSHLRAGKRSVGIRREQ